MKGRFILALTGAMVLGAALAAVAQQDDARQQRWQRWRQAQMRGKPHPTLTAGSGGSLFQ